MLRKKCASLIAGLFVFATTSFALAQDQLVIPLVIPRAVTPPQLSAYVDAVPASAGVLMSDFRQRIPADGRPATRETRAYLSYDDQYFYAVFVAKDDPALIRARIAKREDIEGDDLVILELDTFHDKRRSFSFLVNPYGVQMDSLRTEGVEPDKSFDTQWDSEAQLTQDGYVVKLAIPLKSLRFKSSDVQTWGVAVGRLIARLNEESYAPHVSRQVAGFVPQLASMTIPEKLSAGRNAQLNPYVFAGRSRFLQRAPASEPGDASLERADWKSEPEVQAGLDAKWVIGDAAALDVTLKPDFSDVESDEPQIVTDKRYEVLFPEKRPFFLENAGFFGTPNPLFFSRRIAQPQAGARLTGRADKWAYGALLMKDKVEAGENDAAETSAKERDRTSKVAVMRVQNDLSEDFSVGAVFTEYRQQNQFDRVAGFDARYLFDENWTFQTQLARSELIQHARTSPTPKQKTHLAYLDARHQGNAFDYWVKYLDVGAQFADRLAFLPRLNVKQFTQDGKYLWHLEDEPVVQRLGVQVKTEVAHDQSNQLQDWMLETGVFLEGQGETWFELISRHGFEKFGGRDYRKQGWELDAGTSWYKWLSVSAELGMIDSLNYNAPGDAPQLLGRGRSADVGVTIKPHPQWRVEQKVLWNDLRQPIENAASEPQTIYRDLMWRTKLSYQHDRQLGIRLIADYHLLSSRPGLSTLQAGKQLNADLQMNYTLSPGTSLIAGVGNRQENLEHIAKSWRRVPNLSAQTATRVFVKLSYLYQL